MQKSTQYYIIDLGLMHAYIRLLSSRMSPEYMLTEIFIQFQIQVMFTQDRVACVLIEQSSAQDVVLSLVTVLPKYKGYSEEGR